MSRSILKLFVVVAVMILAVLLFMDATTFALYKADPITGRSRGCYTELEILVGVKRPTGWIRFIELVAAGVPVVSVVVVMLKGRKSE